MPDFKRPLDYLPTHYLQSVRYVDSNVRKETDINFLEKLLQAERKGQARKSVMTRIVRRISKLKTMLLNKSVSLESNYEHPWVAPREELKNLHDLVLYLKNENSKAKLEYLLEEESKGRNRVLLKRAIEKRILQLLKGEHQRKVVVYTQGASVYAPDDPLRSYRDLNAYVLTEADPVRLEETIRRERLGLKRTNALKRLYSRLRKLLRDNDRKKMMEEYAQRVKMQEVPKS